MQVRDDGTVAQFRARRGVGRVRGLSRRLLIGFFGGFFPGLTHSDTPTALRERMQRVLGMKRAETRSEAVRYRDSVFGSGEKGTNR